ncbi:hypothetical protein GOODEAATRI_028529, partial [Goodea atripinnis]
APRNTSATISPSGLVSAGSWVELNCSSRAKPPVNVMWFNNNITISEGEMYSFNASEEGELVLKLNVTESCFRSFLFLLRCALSVSHFLYHFFHSGS